MFHVSFAKSSHLWVVDDGVFQCGTSMPGSQRGSGQGLLLLPMVAWLEHGRELPAPPAASLGPPSCSVSFNASF